MSILRPLPERLLLGPGPSNAHPSVLEAMSRPLVGHLDPAFIALLERVKDGLRTVFGTTNAMTLPISATGSDEVLVAKMQSSGMIASTFWVISAFTCGSSKTAGSRPAVLQAVSTRVRMFSRFPFKSFILQADWA